MSVVACHDCDLVSRIPEVPEGASVSCGPSPKVRALVDFLAEVFGPEPAWDTAAARRPRAGR